MGDTTSLQTPSSPSHTPRSPISIPGAAHSRSTDSPPSPTSSSLSYGKRGFTFKNSSATTTSSAMTSWPGSPSSADPRLDNPDRITKPSLSESRYAQDVVGGDNIGVQGPQAKDENERSVIGQAVPSSRETGVAKVESSLIAPNTRSLSQMNIGSSIQRGPCAQDRLLPHFYCPNLVPPPPSHRYIRVALRMNEDLEVGLYRDFPRLYNLPLGGGFACGDGWEPLLRALSDKLSKLLEMNDREEGRGYAWDRHYEAMVRRRSGRLSERSCSDSDLFGRLEDENGDVASFEPMEPSNDDCDWEESPFLGEGSDAMPGMAVTVKENYGHLQFANLRIPQAIEEEFSDYVAHAIFKSTQTCESCGAKGKMVTLKSGWLATCCGPCKVRREQASLVPMNR